ncbi:MAG: hypothetical protein JKY37_24255 [Nannocystaceae bacterium]|nr:hypothetical protein [Nannocystaceae bacterium]
MSHNLGSRHAVVVAAALATACTFGGDGGGAVQSGSGLGGTIGEETTATPNTADSSSAGWSHSAGADGTSSGEEGTRDEGTRDEGIRDDGSTGERSTSETSSTTSAGSDGDSTTGIATETQHLQNVPFTDCSTPLWCYFGGDVSNGTGVAQTLSECFTSTLTPPFLVTSVQYYVAADNADVGSFDLEVRGWNGGAPGDVITSVPIASNAIANGLNAQVLRVPVQINTPGFCVGFSTPSGLLLGFGVDAASPCGSGTSFQTLEGTGGCNVNNAEICGTMPFPTGNWCIAVDLST